ncbi:MAG: hypothetical protein JSS50_00570 [Proteobacteria bacterium]|nr:hypothetical protein [Pseudomonadota bacterium]
MSMITAPRGYLTSKKIADFSGVSIYDYHDNIADKHCYIVEGFDSVDIPQALQDFIMRRINPHQNVASIAEDSILYCTNDDIIVFRNTSASAIRSAILHDDKPHPYSIAFKTAEFHTYFTLVNHETGDIYNLGVSPMAIGSWGGRGYVRNDTKYDKQYYRGDILVNPNEKNEKIDSASIAIKFDLTREQVLHLEKFVEYTASWWLHPHGDPFNFLFRNCSNFVADAFTAISDNMSGSPDHFYAYAILDELDFMDKGIFYNFIVAYPYDWFSHLDLINDIIFKNVMQPVPYDNVAIGGNWVDTHYPHATYNFINEESWFSPEEIAQVQQIYNIYPFDISQDYYHFLA